MSPGTKKLKKNTGPDQLRSEAEKKLAARPAITRDENGCSSEEVVHELRVHQIELEMQNEALRDARLALEESRDKFVDLYEFAPVGYLTFTDKGIIEEVNLTGAGLLGIDRRDLGRDRFRKYIAESDRERWDNHFLSVLRGGEKQTIELQLRRHDGSSLGARLESIRVEREKKDPVVRVVISDITDRKRAEEFLRVSENRFRVFFQNAPEYCYIISQDMTIRDINKAALDRLGYEESEIIGKPLSFLYAPDTIPRMKKAFRQWLEKGKIVDEEMTIVTKTGERRDVLLSADRHLNEDGSYSSVSMQRDITDRKRAEERLKIFRTFTENARDIVLFIRKSDGGIIEANRKASEAYGYSREELLGMTVFTLRAYDSPSLVREQMDRADEEGILFETVHRKKDGGEIPVEVNSFSLRMDNEPILFSVCRDITERKRAEYELSRLAEERKTLIDNVPAMIWYKDTRNTLIRVNRAGARIFGVTAEEIEGKNASELFPDEAEKYYRDDLEVIGSGQPKLGIVEQMGIPGGDKIWVRTDKIPLKDENGIVNGLLVFVLDITDKKLADDALIRRSNDVQSVNEELTSAGEELRRNELRLSRSLEEKEVLLAEVHHRVKNNLAAFISLLSLDGTYEESPEGQRLKKDLQNRARSMALIHETLYKTRNFSHVDMSVYLTTLVGQIAGTYLSQKSIRTTVNAEGLSLDLARATPCGLIVNELATNVFKYAFPKSFDCEGARCEPCTLRVGLTLADGMYTLTVADNGVGLPASFDLATAQSLGLKLVNFLARHQLRAKVEVSRENGTAFMIRFKEKIGR